ncbi:unnamed protein product, partial [Ectocarpus fasciculatus]
MDQRIEARYHGSSDWYPGTISRDHGGGLYDIVYDDGDADDFVKSNRIRSIADRTPSQLFRDGDLVEARYRGQGQWYPGSISQSHSDGTYDIAYDDGDADEDMKASMIRPLQTQTHPLLAGTSDEKLAKHKLANIFKTLDKDSNGILTTSEIRMLLTSLNIRDFSKNAELVNVIIDQLDLNRDGSVSLKELEAFL